MVWIHGGGWFTGSGGTQMYGPQYLLDKDIILVAINYRLGTLGTLNRSNHRLYVKYTTCHIYCRVRDGSVDVITRLLATRPKIRVKFATETRYFCLLRTAPDRLWDQQTSYLVGITGSFPGSKADGTWSCLLICTLSRLIMSGYTFTTLNLKGVDRDNCTFTVTIVTFVSPTWSISEPGT